MTARKSGDVIEMTETDEGWVLAKSGAQVALKALRDLVDERDVRYGQRFTAQQEALVAALAAAKEAVAAALLAADRAVNKAELAAEKRFESVNEFRKTLSDQQATWITREAVEALMENLRVSLKAENDLVLRLERDLVALSTTVQTMAGYGERMRRNESDIASLRQTIQTNAEQTRVDRDRRTNADRIALGLAGLLLSAIFFGVSYITRPTPAPATTPNVITVPTTTPTTHP